MTEATDEAIARAAFPGAAVSVWHIGGKVQLALDNDSVVRDTLADAIAWAKARYLPVTVKVTVAYEPEAKPDPRIAEMQKRIAELEAREPEVKIVEVEKIVERIVEVAAPAPEPDPEPETHFADLMLADETADDAKARLSQRLKELRHYLIAPEIRVNEDGSLGLTPAEQAELADLERRQTLGRWLEA
jgi:hypothetical protein